MQRPPAPAEASAPQMVPLPITDKAAEVIRPEIEFRLRFIIQEALKLARHSNRNHKVLPTDIATAYNTWARSKAAPFRYSERGQQKAPHQASSLLPASRCSVKEEPLRVYRTLHELLGEYGCTQTMLAARSMCTICHSPSSFLPFPPIT
jgi:TATA box binding protein associated factor (TAF)